MFFRNFWIIFGNVNHLKVFDGNIIKVLKSRFYEKDFEILQNHHLRFVLCSNGQIFGGDFIKFCGLLRIFELYKKEERESIQKGRCKPHDDLKYFLKEN